MDTTLNSLILWTLSLAFLSLSSLYIFKSQIAGLAGGILGKHLISKTQSRREILLEQAVQDNKKYSTSDQRHKSEDLDTDWEKVEGKPREQTDTEKQHVQPPPPDPAWSGIIGFFHPFCNAGGGGERVLWAAIRATQQKWPNALCVVYTGDHDVNKEQILERVENRFDIHLRPPTVTFLYLSTRRYVLSSTWPHFTLLGQSLGSLILAYDAFSLLVPDIIVDTMGYAFALSLSKLLFPRVPTGAYVHYPTISTDMLGSLDASTSSSTSSSSPRGLNANAGRGWKGLAKRHYWRLFARLYSHVGSSIDVVMTNSSWTQSHIRSLWGPSRSKNPRKQQHPIEVVFPPVAVEEIERQVPVDTASEAQRTPTLLYIAQFRPEKNHQLVLGAFAKFLKQHQSASTAAIQQQPNLLLIGSVRDSADETYIYSLRLLAHELHITQHVTFQLNASWPAILARLRTASVGVNAMWNEHFGIGVVEYQAAGLLCVVNDSGGPREDIVVDVDGERTGWHASGEEEYARAFGEAVGMVLRARSGSSGSSVDVSGARGGLEDVVRMRTRARKSARRFGEGAFEGAWVGQMERLVELQRSGAAGGGKTS